MGKKPTHPPIPQLTHPPASVCVRGWVVLWVGGCGWCACALVTRTRSRFGSINHLGVPTSLQTSLASPPSSNGLGGICVFSMYHLILQCACVLILIFIVIIIMIIVSINTYSHNYIVSLPDPSTPQERTFRNFLCCKYVY